MTAARGGWMLGRVDAADDDVDAFLAAYTDACAQVGVVALPLDALVAVVQALLTGAIPAAVTLH